MTSTVDWVQGRITDDALAAMASRIGIERPVRPWNEVATADAIWHFALGVGDDNPLWWDRAYAEASSWRRMFAPPTFLYTATSGGWRPGDEHTGGVDDMLPGVLGFWANDRWHWNQPVWEGTRLEAVAQLEAVEEKQSSFSGRSIAQRDKTTFFGPAGEVLAEYRRTILRLERGEARRRHKYGDYQPARYSEDDLSAIGRQYELEPAQRRGAEPRYWEDVSLGDSLGRLVKGPLTITNVVGFLLGWGSPMCQTNRIAHQYLAEHPGARLFDSERGIEDTLEAAHWDPYFAQMSGLPDGYDFGCQRISWLAHLVTDWCGDEGFLSDLHVFLRRPNHLGDTTWLSGRVVGKRQSDDGGLVDCELTATNQRGDITATGTATVKLPAS